MLRGRAREEVLSTKQPTYEKPDGKTVEMLVDVEERVDEVRLDVEVSKVETSEVDVWDVEV